MSAVLISPRQHRADPPLPSTGCTGPGAVAQFGWFTGIGAVMTVLYLGLYVMLQGPLGAQPANLLAAVADTAANRRLTFGVSGRAGAARAQLQGLLMFGLGPVLTSGSLAVVHAWSPTPGRVLELTVLLGANAAAGVLRFLLLRSWVFSP